MVLDRRKMMLSAMMAESPSQYWDIDWTYKKGLFANSGFDVIINKIASETLLENAVQLYSESDAYIRISVPEYPTCRKGVAEAEFTVTEIGSNFSANGLRLLLSNGTYGCQTLLKKSGSNIVLTYNNGKTNNDIIIISNINIGEAYKLKIEFDETSGNRISLNERLLLESDKISMYYCTGNRFFAQGACTINMHAVRYKFLEV